MMLSIGGMKERTLKKGWDDRALYVSLFCSYFSYKKAKTLQIFVE
jgi:hypothetical protein